MKIDGKRQFELLKKIGFIRTAGSPEELKAANMIKDEVVASGVNDVIFEAFTFKDCITENVEFEVLEPYNKKYTVTAYKCCENTAPDGLVADLVYIENATDIALKSVKGKFVLVNGYMRLSVYKKLIEAGAVGFMTMSGSMLDKDEDSDLFTRKIRDNLEKFGNIPAVNIRVADAFDIVLNKASKIKLTVKNNNVELTSNNIVATIKGTEYPEEIIAIGGHYDSVEFSTGVYDNGAGSVIVMELLRYFQKNPPKRTIKFIWFAAEEIGLLGSKAYVEQHKDDLKDYKYMINIDVAGSVLGYEIAYVTADKSVVNQTEFFMNVNGYPVTVKQSTYSSDSIPFANKGVPGINFCRFGAEGAEFIHCRHDVLKYLSADSLEFTANYILDYTNTVINSINFPINKEMPKEMIEEVDKYLYKKELDELEQKNK